MPGLAFYLGVGISLLGLIYTFMVAFGRDALFRGNRRPYLMNGIALCVLGVSLIGRELFLPRWAVYLLWAVAGALAVQATRIIAAARER